ncbi:MAG: ankyrin repeat domain-containing protein [Holosporaceae bacterium]|nr:ankyrin repeat domain-containing protein [Holosporaceae bacterium]
MIRNYTGYQLIMKMLTVHILNSRDDTEFVADMNKTVTIFEAFRDGNVFDPAKHTVSIYENDEGSLTHELGHVLHWMMFRQVTFQDGGSLRRALAYARRPPTFWEHAIATSDIDLIDLLFPMLSPAVMEPAVGRIQKYIESNINIELLRTAYTADPDILNILRTLVNNGLTGVLFNRSILPQIDSVATLFKLMTPEILAKLIYTYGTAFIDGNSIWTNPEEALNIVGIMPLKVGERTFALEDRQNEGIFHRRSRETLSGQEKEDLIYRFHGRPDARHFPDWKQFANIKIRTLVDEISRTFPLSDSGTRYLHLDDFVQNEPYPRNPLYSEHTSADNSVEDPSEINDLLQQAIILETRRQFMSRETLVAFFCEVVNDSDFDLATKFLVAHQELHSPIIGQTLKRAIAEGWTGQQIEFLLHDTESPRLLEEIMKDVVNDINAENLDANGPTSTFRYLVKEGRFETASIFLKAGISGRFAIKLGGNSLDCALREHWPLESVRFLIQMRPIDVVQGGHFESLIKSDDTSALKVLLDAAPPSSPNTQDWSGATALGYAISEGKPECVKVLLSNPSVDVNYLCFRNKSPLELALNREIYDDAHNREIVDALLTHKYIEIDPALIGRLWPLFLENDPNGRLPLLLDRCPDLGTTSKTGKTLLIEVLTNSKTKGPALGPVLTILHTRFPPDTVRKVLDAEDAEGRTVLDVALQFERAEDVQLLLKEGVGALEDTYLALPKFAAEKSFLNCDVLKLVLDKSGKDKLAARLAEDIVAIAERVAKYSDDTLIAILNFVDSQLADATINDKKKNLLLIGPRGKTKLHQILSICKPDEALFQKVLTFAQRYAKKPATV